MHPTWLIDLLDDENLTVRVLAAEQLISYTGSPEVVAGLWSAATRARRRGSCRASQGACSVADRARYARRSFWRAYHTAVRRPLAAGSRSPGEGAGRARGLGDTTSDIYRLVREKLADADPFVRRAAADALGRHAQLQNVEPLLTLWTATAADDLNLIHVARMALRDQLLKPATYEQLASVLAKGDYAARIAEVSLGVRNADAANYLMSFAEAHALDDARLAEYLHDVVRYAADDRYEDYLRRAQAVAAGSYARQQAALLAIARAAQERGRPVPTGTNEWASRLAASLLAEPQKPSRSGGSIWLASCGWLRPLINWRRSRGATARSPTCARRPSTLVRQPMPRSRSLCSTGSWRTRLTHCHCDKKRPLRWRRSTCRKGVRRWLRN